MMSRRIRAAVLAAALVLGLAGCERFDLGQAALSWDHDGGLVFVPCVGLSANSVAAQFTGPRGTITFLEAVGESRLPEGVPISLSSVPDGMTGVSRPVERDGLTRVEVRFREDGDDGIDLLAGFDGRAVAGLGVGQWLHPDGRVTLDPCEGENSAGRS